MTDDAALRHELIPAPNRTLGPARSLAERTLASLRAQPADVLVTTRRLLVAADGSAMFATIGAAIAVAVSGDEIVVKSGRYAEHLTIDRSIRIRGEGPRELIVLSPPTLDAPCIAITGGSPYLTGFTVEGSTSTNSLPTEDAQVVRITGGSPVLDMLDLVGGLGISFEGEATAGAIRSCSVHQSRRDGLLIRDGATPHIEGNEIWANSSDGIKVVSVATNPLIHANRVHDGQGSGIVVDRAAAPQIEANEIWANALSGIHVSTAGTNPIIRANRVHDGLGVGVVVASGADPLVEDNDIWANAHAGVMVFNAPSTVRANRIHHSKEAGILIWSTAAPRVEENEIWANAQAGIEIRNAGTDPIIRANRIHDGLHWGIVVWDSATPQIEDNEIWANALSGISIQNADPDPLVRANQIHDGRGNGVAVADGAAPQIEDNEIWTNAEAGIEIRDAGTSPIVRANRIHHGRANGIYVWGSATPQLDDNEIWANAGAGLHVSGAGTSPVVIGNTLRDGLYDGIFVSNGASPTIHGNTITGNAGLAIRVEDDARPIIGPTVGGISRGSAITSNARTALDWTPAERELARAGHPQVARFLRLVAELEPSARDQIGSRIVLDDRFKLAARSVVAAAAAASPAFDVEKHVAQAIAERQSLATSSTALFRSALLVMGVALGIYSRLDADAWNTVWAPNGLGDPIVPFVTLWSPLSGEPAEFRSTLAMEAVADMQADMSRKMADIAKNL